MARGPSSRCKAWAARWSHVKAASCRVHGAGSVSRSRWMLRRAQLSSSSASRSRGADACASTMLDSKSVGWAKVQYNQARLGAVRSQDTRQGEVEGQSERRPASLRNFARGRTRQGSQKENEHEENRIAVRGVARLRGHGIRRSQYQLRHEGAARVA